MSGSETFAGGPSEAIPEESRRPGAACGSPAAACMCGAIGGAIQRICPTNDEVKETTERLRDSIRAQPIIALAVAVGLGVLVGRLAGARTRTGGARR